MEQVVKACGTNQEGVDGPDEIIFVMDSSIGQAAFDQAAAFKSKVNVGSVIITKLDGHARGGGALSAVAATSSPITFIGTGEHIDEFEPFVARSFISRLLGMGDIEGLVSKIKDAGIDTQAPDMMKRLQAGEFSIRDLREQFSNVMKMGPLSDVMSMIPGMGAEMFPKGQEKHGQERIRRWLCMMDSMTDDELDMKVKLGDSRRDRVARGSGRHPRELEEMLVEHTRLQKVVGKMKNLKMSGPGGKMNPADMARNMGSIQQMAKMMDPRVLKQMGGMGNFQNMVKQMSQMEGMMDGGAGGMPDMGEMMKQMGGMPGMGGAPGGGGGGRRR